MSDALREATGDALACLMTMNRDGVRPDEAQRRLRLVQAQHPHLELELVWEQESYDGDVHYDALLRAPGGTTVSVSFCRDGALPWPLRGVRRWSDADLAQVNGRILKFQDAVSFLDFVWKEAPLMDRMINVCLLREELERHPIEISDAELQRGLDDLRRANRLYDAAQTRRFMQERGMTHEQLEGFAADTVTLRKLGERISHGRVERYFEEHRGDFDVAQVARIVFADEASARRVHREIASGELDFFMAAQKQFLAAPRQERSLFATLRRRDLPALFDVSTGALLGPIRIGDEQVLLRLLAREQARLDDATRATIEERMLDDWLAERRRGADVTWFWGTADREPKAA